MKRYPILLVIIAMLALLLISGCGQSGEGEQEPPAQEEPEREPEEEPATDEPVSHLPGEIVEERPTGPEEFEGTIELEGMEEPMKFVRTEFPEIGVATYIPKDLEVVESESATTVRIVADYGGTPREDVYLEIDLHGPGASLDEITASLEEQMEEDGYEIDEVADSERQHSWGIREWQFESEDRADYGGYYVGRVIFGNAGERTLVITTHMPVEFGDGTVPRFRRVMEEMKWYLDWK